MSRARPVSSGERRPVDREPGHPYSKSEFFKATYDPEDVFRFDQSVQPA